MLAEVQPSDLSFHHLLDLALWNPSEAGKHCPPSCPGTDGTTWTWDLVVTKEHTRDNLGGPQLSWDRWDNLDLGLGGDQGAY